MYVIKEPKENSFEKVGIQGKIFPVSNAISSIESILIETGTGHETTIIEHGSDFIYYVLEGAGYFEIEDKKEECAAGDLVVVPRGKKFTYKGKLKMLLTVAPPWREDQEEVLK